MQLKNGMTWDGPDGEALEKAVSAMNRLERGHRGILFAGAVGSGKTTAACLLARTARVIDCAIPNQVAWLDDWRDLTDMERDIILDDLGREAIRNDFGNKRNIVAEKIHEIHSAWKSRSYSGRLFVTTNLTSRDLRGLYDASIFDRLMEMCIPCKFSQGRRPMAVEWGEAEPPSPPPPPPLRIPPPPPPAPADEAYPEELRELWNDAKRVASVRGEVRPEDVSEKLAKMLAAVLKSSR